VRDDQYLIVLHEVETMHYFRDVEFTMALICKSTSIAKYSLVYIARM